MENQQIEVNNSKQETIVETNQLYHWPSNVVPLI